LWRLPQTLAEDNEAAPDDNGVVVIAQGPSSSDGFLRCQGPATVREVGMTVRRRARSGWETDRIPGRVPDFGCWHITTGDDTGVGVRCLRPPVAGHTTFQGHFDLHQRHPRAFEERPAPGLRLRTPASGSGGERGVHELASMPCGGQLPANTSVSPTVEVNATMRL
jgi:hypothetical protein